MKLFILLMLFSRFATAYEIAFIEIKDAQGRVVQLEKGGRFAHIAIFFDGQWLHSHPYRGVELVAREVLEKTGSLKVIVSTPGPAQPSLAIVKKFLGKPYDYNYTWGDDKIYCSELIAKILEIQPTKMQFNADVWSQRQMNGERDPGISPDDIYAVFQRNGYRAHHFTNMCSDLF